MKILIKRPPLPSPPCQGGDKYLSPFTRGSFPSQRDSFGEGMRGSHKNAK